MIKIETKMGTTKVEASGNNAELYADACMIVRSIYTSLKDELSDKDVAEMFKKECVEGEVFEAPDEKAKEVEEKKGKLDKLLDELIELLDEKGND